MGTSTFVSDLRKYRLVFSLWDNTVLRNKSVPSSVVSMGKSHLPALRIQSYLVCILGHDLPALKPCKSFHHVKAH